MKLTAKQLAELMAIHTQVVNDVENATEGLVVHGIHLDVDYTVKLSYRDENGDHHELDYDSYLEQVYSPKELAKADEESDDLYLTKSDYQF